MNLNKSTLMVIRKSGGRRRIFKFCAYSRRGVEVLNSYPYLSGMVTSSLSMFLHLKEKEKLGKCS